ncbi:MAG: hypothetical protein HY738_16330 [Bacteroidia bacterium]|nr:hypothetical protein [Bacteroidia bacterium]
MKSNIKKKWLALSNNQMTIQIPVIESYRGNIAVHFTFIRDNRFYNHYDIIEVPYSNKRLDIEFETFRNKLYPGEKEQWKIKIKGKQGEKVAAEMVAAMYDASLDQFRQNTWYFDIYQRYFASRYWQTQSFTTLASSTLKRDFDQYYPFPYQTYNSFNWFGFYYYGGYYGATTSKGEGRKYHRYAVSAEKEAPPPPSETTGAEVEDAKMSIPSVKAVDITTTTATVGFIPPGKQEVPAKADLSGIKARTNFNETAFFYPHLMTNEEGEVIIQFTIPEALTRWKMLGFAHSKNLEYGLAENELITQKELMLLPNPPRFFRENDLLKFPVKISNVSAQDLSGTAQLELFDAITMKPVQGILTNEESRKNFNVKAGLNTIVSWKLTIPEGIQAVDYKIVAKSDKFSDGEENVLPVLSNRMLVTESLPLPIRGKQTKQFRFEKLINSSASATLRHQQLTLEFTSNPAWYAVQALPYIIEYPYECYEQVFSRYYANSIASFIANSSPKIKAVFDSWRNTPDSKALLSNLEKNQELKNLLLEETPWVLNAQDEKERKKRIGLLFDLNKMASEQEIALKKLIDGQASNGGWPWFAGMPDCRYITQHIVCGMGHLDHLGIKYIRTDSKIWNMIENAAGYLDDRIREDYEWLKKHYTAQELEEQHIGNLEIHYLYARSFFSDIEIKGKNKVAFDYYKKQAEKYWLNESKYLQSMIALALYRSGNQKIPNDLIKSLNEHAISSDEMGMYWKEPVGYFWYEAPIERQALMIELYNEVAKNQKAVDELKIWLLKQKQTQDWKTTKATVEAVYALLLQGNQWLESEQLVQINLDNIQVDPKKMDDIKIEAGTGYFKTSWNKNEIKPEMGDITVAKADEGIAWGAVYWQYFEQLDKITPHETPLRLAKKLFIERLTPSGKVIEPLTEKLSLKVGDKVIVRIELRVDRDMEYIHLKDMRAAGFEPVNVISRYKYQDGLGYYESTRDAATNFFISYIPKGTYIFEYPLRVSHKGDFSNGITTVQCMYAPEFASHSQGIRVKVNE